MASADAKVARSTAKLEPKTQLADEDAGEANDGSLLSGTKDWFGRATANVSNFLKANEKAMAGRTQLCETAQDRWVQDGDGNWVECTNVSQF